MKINYGVFSILLLFNCFYTQLLAANSNTTSTCEIISFDAEYIENSCSGEIIEILFEFEAVDFGTQGFEISSDNGSQFYNLGDDYVFWEITYCTEPIILTITDVSDPSCTAVFTLEPACCECIIDEPLLNPTECEQGTFDVHVAYFDLAGSCVNYDWYLELDGVEYPLVWDNSTNSLIASDIIADDEIETVMLCNESPLEECWNYEIINPCFDIGGACTITSFNAEYITESCDGELIEVAFDFDATDFGSEGFQVSNDGNGTQLYNLGDDYTFSVISLCSDVVILTLTDVLDPTCSETITIEPACCDCEIEEPVLEANSCSDDQFDIHVEWFEQEGSCVSYGWYLDLEGLHYLLDWNGQYYEALALTAEDSLLTIMLCNESPLEECWTYLIENPCYEEDNSTACSISSFTAEYVQNSCYGEIIEIEFDFNASDFGAEGFEISTEGGSQLYNLDDDYIFGVISLCTDSLELTITDIVDPDCSTMLTIGPACCDCAIEEPVMEATECNDEQFDIHVEFFVSEGTCVNYDWYLLVEGQEYVLDWNGQYYEAQEVFADDSLLTVLLCNEGPLNECWTYLIDNPCFESDDALECSISNFTAEYVQNSCYGEIIEIEFDFNASDFGAEGFEISTEGGSQLYNLDDDYIFGVISLCTDSLELTITDIVDPDCSTMLTIGPACCDCAIEEPVMEATECNDEQFDIHVGFFVSEGTCVNYDWYLLVEGQEYVLDWNGQYYEAQEVFADDSLLTVLLCNEGPLNECWTYLIDNPCFESDDVLECSISNFAAEYIPMSCEGEIVSIAFEIDAIDFGSQGFEISSDYGNQFYSLNSDYEYYAISLCADPVILTVTDIADPDCSAIFTLEPACCDCAIEEPVMEATECNDGQFDIHVEFFESEGTCVNYDWYLLIEGQEYFLDWNGQYFEALEIVAEDSILSVQLCNDGPLNECWDYLIENSCEDISNCVYEDINIEALMVNDDAVLRINIESNAFCSNRFEVWLDGISYGVHEINEPDYIIADIVFNGAEIHVEICEEENPDVCESFDLDNPITTSVDELTEESMRLFYDANGGVYVENKMEERVQLTLYDLQGKIILKTSLDAKNRLSLNMENNASGFYFIKVEDALQGRWVRKLIHFRE